jgi:hypothetical protein
MRRRPLKLSCQLVAVAVVSSSATGASSPAKVTTLRGGRERSKSVAPQGVRPDYPMAVPRLGPESFARESNLTKHWKVSAKIVL